MKWITRRNLHIDRTSCPWLIRQAIDPEAEFVFVAPDTNPATLEGHTFDMPGAEYSHEDGRCTFQVFVERHDLASDPALEAIIRGFQLTTPDDHEKLRRTAPLYDALYAYCQAKVADRPRSQGTPRPRLSYQRRVQVHLEEES
jgi:hypothetical protein